MQIRELKTPLLKSSTERIRRRASTCGPVILKNDNQLREDNFGGCNSDIRHHLGGYIWFPDTAVSLSGEAGLAMRAALVEELNGRSYMGRDTETSPIKELARFVMHRVQSMGANRDILNNGNVDTFIHSVQRGHRRPISKLGALHRSRL